MTGEADLALLGSRHEKAELFVPPLFFDLLILISLLKFAFGI